MTSLRERRGASAGGDVFDGIGERVADGEGTAEGMTVAEGVGIGGVVAEGSGAEVGGGE
jgi:hypothetical protein